MSTFPFRSLRVQVLLWTILPLIIVLLILSLTGIGSHQFSIRQLVAEENMNLLSTVSAAVDARLQMYSALLATQAQSEGSPAGAVVGASAGLPSLEVWRVDALGAAVDGSAAPAWVTNAVTLAARQSPPVAERVLFDAATQRITWVLPQASPAGWVVGSIESAGLGLGSLFRADANYPAPKIAVVDAQRRLVDANFEHAAVGRTLGWPEAAQALAGERGVHFVSTADRQGVIAFAPIAGTPWALLIRRPITDLIAPFFRLEQVLPLMLVAAAVVSFLTLYFGLSLVVRPVRSLVEYAGRIGQGDFRAAAQRVGGLQEIEDLRQALDAMAQRLQGEQLALQDYLRAVTTAQEEERARLARELHDETVQTLIALDHKAQLVQRGLDKHPERTREQVAELRKITSSATQEVRRLSYGLRPLCLEEIGLDSALERLAQDTDVEYCLQGEPCRLAPEKELALYRIAQESLSNARRHAHARSVRMAAIFGPTTVTVGVGDDGAGFDLPPKLSDLTRDGHFGLMGVTERSQLIGGRLYVESARGRGTTIIVQAARIEGAPPGLQPLDEPTVAAVRAWLCPPSPAPLLL